MRIKYEDWKPGADAIQVIAQADAICRDYRAQGYDLTLRQLYYQFVARALIPNTDRSYKRLGSIVNKARMAGLLDWDYIVDRTRNIRSVGHFKDPAAIIDVATRAFALDKWATQSTRVEVWVEKEALAGVVGQVADRLDVAWFSCRGYVSQSELWGAAQRLMGYVESGQRVVVLHLGDHDPSGIDMTRDITDRLRTFSTQDYLNVHADEWTDDGNTTVGEILREMRVKVGLSAVGHENAIEVNRIALNFDQVEEYQPPPNPAKMTDSRVEGYIAAHGYESWELDALDPATLDALIESHVLELRDEDAWGEIVAIEDRGRSLLTECSDRWEDVVTLLEGGV